MRISLNIGIDYAGVIYRDCMVSLLTIGGECQAQEAISEMALPNENRTVSQERLADLAYLAQQVEIVGIPVDVNAAFLFDHLTNEDYWQLIEATLQLRKKRWQNGESKEQTPPNQTAETA